MRGALVCASNTVTKDVHLSEVYPLHTFGRLAHFVYAQKHVKEAESAQKTLHKSKNAKNFKKFKKCKCPERRSVQRATKLCPSTWQRQRLRDGKQQEFTCGFFGLFGNDYHKINELFQQNFVEDMAPKFLPRLWSVEYKQKVTS